MLAKRVASAVVAIPVILYLVYIGDIWYTLLVWLVAVLGMREYIKMLQLSSKVPGYMGIGAVTALFAAIHFYNPELILIVLILVFFLSTFYLVLRFENAGLEESTSVFWGIIYVGGLLGFLVLLRNTFAYEFTVLIFVIVWLNDTFAYFAGNKWGKRKLAPVISPGKTIEGSLGGLLGPVIFLTLLYFVIGDYYPLSLGLTIVLTFLVTVFAQAGDLVESALKRKLNTKDSGGLIPGHGGILDRFDSLMLAAPFMYFFLLLVI